MNKINNLDILQTRYSDLKHWLFDPGERTEDYDQAQWSEVLDAVKKNWLSGKCERMDLFTAKVIATVGAVGLLGVLAAENPVTRTLGLAFGLGACARASGAQLVDLNHNGIPDHLEQAMPTGIPTPELGVDLTPRAPDFSLGIPDMPVAFGDSHRLALDLDNNLSADACGNIADQPMTYYTADNQLHSAEKMTDAGFTPLFSFSAVGSDGVASAEYCLASTGLNSSHLLIRGETSWNDMTSSLENPATQDGLFKVGEKMYSPLGIFNKNGALPMIGFEVGSDGEFTGEAVVYVDGNYQALDIGDADFSKGAGLSALAPDFDLKSANIIDHMSKWGLDSGQLNYSYHAGTGELGVDLGNGVFVTIDGQALIGDFVEVNLDGVQYENGEFKGVKGYILDKATGEWGVAQEIFTTENGLRVEFVSEMDASGAREIKVLPPTKYEGNEAAQDKFLNYFDAERLGFDEGATKWIEVDGRAVLVDASDTSKIIAEYKTVNMTGLPGVVWNWENFVEADGENPLLDVCKNWETKWKNGIPKDLPGIVNFAKALNGREAVMLGGGDMMYGGGEEFHASSVDGAIFSDDGKSMVYYRQIHSPYSTDEGFVVTRDLESKPVILYVENMVWESY